MINFFLVGQEGRINDLSRDQIVSTEMAVLRSSKDLMILVAAAASQNF